MNICILGTFRSAVAYKVMTECTAHCNVLYSHLQCTSIHAHVLTWFNFNFLHQSLNIDPELYLNVHSGSLKNVLGQKDKQSCMHAFLQAVTAVKFPRKYSRQRDVTIITSTHVVSIIIREEPGQGQTGRRKRQETEKGRGTKGNSKFRLISHDSCIT